MDGDDIKVYYVIYIGHGDRHICRYTMILVLGSAHKQISSKVSK